MEKMQTHGGQTREQKPEQENKIQEKTTARSLPASVGRGKAVLSRNWLPTLEAKTEVETAAATHTEYSNWGK